MLKKERTQETLLTVIRAQKTISQLKPFAQTTISRPKPAAPKAVPPKKPFTNGL